MTFLESASYAFFFFAFILNTFKPQLVYPALYSYFKVIIDGGKSSKREREREREKERNIEDKKEQNGNKTKTEQRSKKNERKE